jgi:hypothetical protein
MNILNNNLNTLNLNIIYTKLGNTPGRFLVHNLNIYTHGKTSLNIIFHYNCDKNLI